MCEYKVCEIASILLWCGLEFRTRCISFIWSCYVSLTHSLSLVHSFHLTHYWVMLRSPVVHMWNPSLFSIVVAYNKPILRLSRSFSCGFGYLLLFPWLWLAPVGRGLIGRWFWLWLWLRSHWLRLEVLLFQLLHLCVWGAKLNTDTT